MKKLYEKRKETVARTELQRQSDEGHDEYGKRNTDCNLSTGQSQENNMMSDAKKDAKRQAVKNNNKEKLEPLTNWYESPSKVKRCWIKNCVVETVGKESTPSRTLRAKSGTVDCKYVVVSHCSEMAFKRVFFSGFLSEILAPTGFITTACRGKQWTSSASGSTMATRPTPTRARTTAATTSTNIPRTTKCTTDQEATANNTNHQPETNDQHQKTTMNNE